MSVRAKKRKLRSSRWYGRPDKDGFIHRSWMKSQGLPDEAFDGRPVIGICNTWSELTPCNAHLRDLATRVKSGVWEAGGVPLEFPVMSLGETQMRPTAMLFRNLVAMDVEESIRANPIDGVVLLGGCDKTTPAQIMGACSVGLPFIVVSSGPMLNGKFRGRDIGSGTDVWRFSQDVRTGAMSAESFLEAERCMSRSHGTCMTMGTASTMACLVEAMGLSLPDNGTIPAVDSHRSLLAHRSGRRIVEMVCEDLRPEKILTRSAFENAIRASAAIGGSTNAVIHLQAIAGRQGVALELDDWARIGRNVPLVVDLMPAGRYLMEDFHYAGGLAAVLKTLSDRFDLAAPTVGGGALGDGLDRVECCNSQVIRPADNPLQADGGIAVLRGNLAPGGAILKTAAASRHLLNHRGRAVVFEDIEDLHQRIDRDDLEVDAESVLVLKGCGPCGYPGMPEVGNMPLPAKLARQGVRDMVRISDARMSGTAFGTVVLHVVPESAVGGPLALVQSGDLILLDVPKGRLTLEVDASEMERRRRQFRPKHRRYERGYYRLYQNHVLQADQGADFDFLVGGSGSDINRESH